MRDHTGLRAFTLADELALMVYRSTQHFPRSEQFGLTGQMRRAAVSAASNIVEGSARSTRTDFVHFLDMAFGSLREVEYQASLAHRLGLLSQEQYSPLQAHCTETSKVLAGLIRAIRKSNGSAG